METIRNFLERRERELLESIRDLWSRLAPLQTELADIQRTKAELAMTTADRARDADLLKRAEALAWTEEDDRECARLEAARMRPAVRIEVPPVAELSLLLTLKGLIYKALGEHFPNGATSRQLLDFFRVAWDRKIKQRVLSPQLARLQADGYVECQKDRRPALWKLTPLAAAEEELKAWGIIPAWAKLKLPDETPANENAEAATPERDAASRNHRRRAKV
jgi:hypothetical protein